MKPILQILLGVIMALAVPAQARLYLFNKDFDLQIPQDPTKTYGPMNDAVIDIDINLPIKQLTVGLTIEHENIFDLQIALISPAGTALGLNSFDTLNLPEMPDGQNWQNYTNTVFSDDAQLCISQAKAPFTGIFRPKHGQLAAFTGQNAFGQWKLRVNDLWQGHTGKLTNFQLHVYTPEPTTLALTTLALAVLTLSKNRPKNKAN